MYEDVDSQLEYLRVWFESMKENGFNPNEDLTWCYAFRNADVEKLKKLAQHLESQQYEIEDLFEDDDPDDEESAEEYILSVKKVEKHTPETLAQQNVEFARLASVYGYAAEKVSFP